jgi:hypothetical protein
MQANCEIHTAVQGRQPPPNRSLAPAFRHRRSFQRVRSVDQIRAPRSARLHSPVASDPTRDFSKLLDLFRSSSVGLRGRPQKSRKIELFFDFFRRETLCWLGRKKMKKTKKMLIF